MSGNDWPDFPTPLHQRRVGVMRCCWGQTSFAEHCRIAAEIGAGYVEDFAHNLDPAKVPAAEARAALEAAGIPLLLVIAPHIDCDDPAGAAEALKPQLETWQAAGLTTFVTLRAKRGPAMADFLTSLEACATAVRAAGLTPVTQNHRGGVVESAEELAACREAGVALHFDTQQFPMAGHDALAAWELVGPHVRHVHLGDRDAEIEGVPFGDGIVRMRELLQRMHATGYRGAMSVETEYGPNDASARPVVAQAVDFVNGVLAPLGAGGTTLAADDGHAQVAAGAIECIETDWGRLHWVSNDRIFGGCEQTLGLVTIHPGRTNGLHRHPTDQEVIYVQRGRCRHVCGDREVVLEAGDVLFIPVGQVHGATNIGDEPLDLVVTYPTGCRSFEDCNHLLEKKVQA